MSSGVSSRVDAEDADVTPVGVAQACDARNGGGLPGAGGAEDAEDLAGRHGKGDIRDGHLLAIGLPEVMHLHDGVWTWDSLSRCTAGSPKAPHRKG